MSEQNQNTGAEEVPTEVAEEVAPVEAAEAATTGAPPPPPQTPKERKATTRERRGTRRGATPQERDATRKAKAAQRSRYRAGLKARRAARGEGPAEGTPKPEREPGSPQVRQGMVVSAKGDKTIVVRVDSARRHKRYQKIVRSSARLHAHDERNDAGEGDLVRIVETRPMSRTKRWRLTDVLERAR